MATAWCQIPTAQEVQVSEAATAVGGARAAAPAVEKKRLNTVAADRNEIIKERDLRLTTYDDHHRRLLQTTYDDDDITERSVDYDDDDDITERSVDESIVSKDEDIGKDGGNDKDGADNDGREEEEIEKKVTYWLPEVPGVFMAPDGNTKAMNKAPRPKLLHVLVA